MIAQKRILLIDGDQTVLEELETALVEAGYQVQTASDGEQGLKMVEAAPPDLVVLDPFLPAPNGFEICTRLKGDPRLADIPIVILSDVFIVPDDLQGLKLGAERLSLRVDACLTKPLQGQELLRQIGVLLGEPCPEAPAVQELILVVDDDGLNRQLLSDLLQSAGYLVMVAADGDAGWASFQSYTPSLVMLDFYMPGLDGLEVLARIRAQQSDAAVIVMTAYGSEAVAVQALKQGADDYLIKPLQPWQVGPIIEENLEKARLRRLMRQLMGHLRQSNVRLIEKHRDLQTQKAAVEEAYRRLQEEEQMRRQLVSMVVHDLKNPLNVMLLSIDLLAADFGDLLSEEQRDILRSANTASQQMLHLITNLLEVQRLEDGKMPVYPRPLDMAQLLKLTVAQAQPLAEQKSITLEYQLAGSVPPVLADVELTSRVVANLLDNAIKFTPVAGQITVTAGRSDGEVVAAVIDNGPGIPLDQQSRVFEKFAQVDHGPRRGKASVGLGLAFCKLAIEAQGGRIWVESEPGTGSQFKFVLPVAG
ncbi:MAG: response regulator [Chloroflexota bacterium]